MLCLRYVHTYMSMYIYVSIYTHTHLYVPIHILTHMGYITHMHVHVYTHACIKKLWSSTECGRNSPSECGRNSPYASFCWRLLCSLRNFCYCIHLSCLFISPLLSLHITSPVSSYHHPSSALVVVRALTHVCLLHTHTDMHTEGLLHVVWDTSCCFSFRHTHTQSVLNDPSFNPTTGCMDSKQCTGKGGLLAFMQVSKTVCTSAGSGMWGATLGDGEIAGIVIGSVVGGALLCCVLWMGFCRKKQEG
jgi:hypothetical protein